MKQEEFRGYLSAKSNEIKNCSDLGLICKLDQYGPIYNKLNAREKAIQDINTHGMRYLAMLELVRHRFENFEKHKMIEIGCNTGFLSIFYKELNPQADVIAIDMAKKQIDINETLKKIFNSTVTFANLSGQEASQSFGTTQFDLVYLCEILEHIDFNSPEQIGVLRNALDIVKEDGVVVITVPFENSIPSPGHKTEFKREMLCQIIESVTPYFIDLDWVRSKFSLQKHFIFIASKSPDGLKGFNA